MTEQWKPVVGFEGYYEVSDQGRVRGLPRLTSRNTRYHATRILRPTLNAYGYYSISLKVDGREKRYYVHAMVLQAFVGPAPRGTQTRHLDGVRTHNQMSNLRWGTRVENAADRVGHGTAPIGSRNGCAKLHENDVPAIRAAYASGDTQTAIARRYGVHRMVIQKLLRGETWSHA